MNPGDKVLCIDDDFSRVISELLEQSNGIKLNFPKKDEEYTVREIFDNEGIVTSILLEEISNPYFYIPVIKGSRELSFASWRFVMRKTKEEQISESVKSTHVLKTWIGGKEHQIELKP